MSSLVVCLMAAVTASPALADGSRLTAPAPQGDLTALSQADLRVRLEWARYYLATLERNDRHAESRYNPQVTRDRRLSYAIGKTAAETGLLAATAAVVAPQVKTSAKSWKAMHGPTVKKLKKDIKDLRHWIFAAPRAEARGEVIPGPLKAKELVEGYQRQLSADITALENIRTLNKYKPMQRIGRAAVISLGIGVAAWLVTDMGVTWFQVRHTGADIEERKQDLREFIAYAEQRLAGDDQATPPQR